MLYYLYRFGKWLTLETSLKTGYCIALLVAGLHYAFSRKDRRAVINNLSIILGPDHPQLHAISRRVFINFGKYLVDFFRFEKLDKLYIEQHVEVVNRHCIDEALAKGKGVITLSAHIGNWELGAAVISILKYPLHVVVLAHTDPRINNLFIGQRNLAGIWVIPLGIALRRCFEVLKSGEMLALLGDRDFGDSGIEMPFFGRQAQLPRGPAHLAIKTGAAIVPVFLIRKCGNNFKLIWEPPIEYAPTGNLDLDEQNIMKQYIPILERYIREYPDQWYMFREFWKRV